MLQLIPGADEGTTGEGVFTLDRLKAGWRPAPAHLRTKSFPTPFAQSEMMSHVLGMLELIPGARQVDPEAENPALHQTFERWRLLLLGVVLGHVSIDNIDLRSPAARHFGATLAKVRPEAPHLGLLRATDRTGIEGRQLVLGATDPRCLLWCSTRLGSYPWHADSHWIALKSQIDSSPMQRTALQLLADWREVFRNNGYWVPGHASAPPWMRAVEVLLGSTEHTDRRLLSEDARLVGPVQLAVPAKGAVGTESMLAYLPVLHPGWGERFAELLFFRPVQRERDAGVVDLVDPVGRKVAEIPMAPRHASPGMELLSGVGQVLEHADVPRVHGTAHWLEDQPGAPGFRRVVFEPLMVAAARSHRRARIEERDVQSFPVLYPDALRLLLLQPGSEEAGGVRIQLSRAVTSRLRSGDRAPQTAVTLASWNPQGPLPRAVAVPAGAGALSVGLVENFGPADRVVDVGEVRALGFALWLVFIGEAHLRSDGAKVVWSAAEEQELFGRSVRTQGECPLEIHRDALDAIHDEAERVRGRDRLATLQRFRRSWESMGEGDASLAEVQGARLGRMAARAFVDWVLAGRARVGDFGSRVQRATNEYAIADGVRLPLLVDSYARWG